MEEGDSTLEHEYCIALTHASENSCINALTRIHAGRLTNHVFSVQYLAVGLTNHYALTHPSKPQPPTSKQQNKNLHHHHHEENALCTRPLSRGWVASGDRRRAMPLPGLVTHFRFAITLGFPSAPRLLFQSAVDAMQSWELGAACNSTAASPPTSPTAPIHPPTKPRTFPACPSPLPSSPLTPLKASILPSTRLRTLLTQ